MLFFRRPQPQHIRAVLDSQAELTVSYDPKIARQAWAGLAPQGLALRQHRVLLGHGGETFAAAREAIDAWQMFPRTMTTPWPDRVPIAVGHDVAILCRTWGLWSILPSRIVAVHTETGATERYGFTYGTLQAHVESGEERFTVAWDHSTDEVLYELAAFSRNQWWLARLTGPLVRYQQHQFVQRSLKAMAESVGKLLSEKQRTVEKTTL